ncbi:MAG TPA: cytochrome c [Burkholderiales bacterium]|nr:cytochrome c [Burkholderiales bacterium]
MTAMFAPGDPLRFLAAVLASLACAGAGAQTAESLGAPPGDAKRGGQIFMKQLCHTCHGTVGQGGERGAGPRIYPNPFPYQAFLTQVRKPRQAMPPYTEVQMTDQDLADIYHYLFSTKPSPAAKDIPLLKDF